MQMDFPPGLYIVATPIGNLGDVSARAAAILAAADIVAVEDSRVTAKLLRHLGLHKKMRAYHDHSGERDRGELLAAAGQGVVALVSDAGTPLISDPGYKLVRAAHAAGVLVTSAPGPSAAIMALSISGLPTDRFLFAGFLPTKDKAKADMLAELSDLRATLIFYESGPRLGRTLGVMAKLLGEAREGAVARELTKRHEEVATGTLAGLAERYAEGAPKGEIVLLVGPPLETADAASEEQVEAALLEALDRLPTSKAAGEVARRFGRDRKALYALATELKARS
ncbi:16S rRNA (cytidine(1402)-2'-O)-methyltransferase [Novosphingopyxis sp.]|uniref:16S rRNA (cytidine(1402)-2'-O)-methyltransferase n=1 Tax=Novosphingopyxis sp. TaxID=2709690 RepID=UPI003B5B1187